MPPRHPSAPGPGGGFTATKPKRLPVREADARVVELREAGKSYSAIARTLAIARAVDAQRMFIRCLDSHSEADRSRLVEREAIRLDRIAERIRQRDAGHPDKIERRLSGVDKLREAIHR